MTPKSFFHVSVLRVFIVRVAAVAVLVCLCTGAWADSLDFYQVDFNLDGTVYIDSEWGSLDLTYTGDAGILYFNLAVDGNWGIQNIPVLSREGAGVDQTTAFSFDLGVPRGTPVSTLNYDYALTATVQDTMPGGSFPATVLDRSVVAYSGARGVSIPPLPAASPLIGGAAATPDKHAHSGFPNQESGHNECVPTAVSNSLQFLNARHSLGIDPSEITIAKMKTATNWAAAHGVWIEHDDTRPPGQRNAWWEDKDAYMQAHDALPITTRKITEFDDVAGWIEIGADIELQGDWHGAAIVGITYLGAGKYQIDVAHDTKQDALGGTQVDPLIYDETTRKFKGSPGWFDGSSFRYAIVEIPEPATFSLLIVGGLILTRRRRR